MALKYYTFCALILLIVQTTSTSAFFLNWGSPAPVKPQLPPQFQQQQQQWPPSVAYYQRVMQQQQYVDSNGVPVQIPAIPIQVPLQAQLAPANSVHNVQLVPCLCPVAQDMEYVENNVPITVSQPKQQQPLQQQQQQLQQRNL